MAITSICFHVNCPFHLPLPATTQAFRLGALCKQESVHCILNFGPSSITATTVDRMRGLMHPSTILHVGTTYPNPRDIGEVIIFLPFLMAGLVLPFSLFFIEVLEAYTIHMCISSPTNAFEMFGGVLLSMELFYHYLNLYQSSWALPGPGVAPRLARWADAISRSSQDNARNSSPSRLEQVGELRAEVTVRVGHQRLAPLPSPL